VSGGYGLAGTADASLSGKGKDNNVVAAYRTATKILTDEISSNVNILAIPGIRDVLVTDFAMEQVKNYGLAIYLMDVLGYDSEANRLFDDSRTKPDVRETSEQFDSRAINNNYVASYFPDVFLQDPVNNRPVKVPASVAALGALAFNDKVSYPWFAPAGFNRGALEDVTNVVTRLNSEDRDVLYDTRINPIATFPAGGFVIFGQKTLQQAKSALDRVNVRRLLLEVKRLVSAVAKGLLFEQNDAVTRSKFVSQVTPLLGLIQAQAGLERFQVVCDATNNTELDVEANRMNGRIVIVPTRAIEFISIDFIITNSGVSFE
jgi:phage tail sheath protein FI